MTNKHQTVDLIRRAAEVRVSQSRYRNSSRELKLAYILGWLLCLLAERYSSDPELRRIVDRLLRP